MFGYVRVAKDELRLKDIDRYQSYYCGVCRSIGKLTKIGRIFLSYDAVFYSLLLDFDAKCNLKEGRCCVSLKKKAFAVGELIDYSACIGFLLAMWKVRDNVKDEGNINKLVLDICKKAEKRTAQNIPDAVLICERHFAKLNMLEKQKCNSADECAAIFSDLCADLCAQTPFSADKDIKRTIHSIGKTVGKWVYIIDAIDDYHKDVKNKNFNPFYFEVESGKISVEDIADIAGGGLYRTLEDAYLGVNLLPNSSNKAILTNIISYGMYNITDNVLKEFKKKA